MEINSQEIENALKEFELNQKQRITPQVVSENESRLVQFVIKNFGGIIKDTKYAKYFLFGFAIVLIIISLWLVFGRSDTKADIKLLPAELI